MYYAKKNRNGDIGEYYFAYWITQTFGWPCRLLDIDLGLDAQIEICDQSYKALGQFIAVQIKSTDSKKMSTSLNLHNLQYWSKMQEPVVVVRIIEVDNVEPILYWKVVNTKSISKLITTAKSNSSKTATLSFTEENRLTIDEKENFRFLPALKNLDVLEESSRVLKEKFLDLLSPYYISSTQTYGFDNTGCDDDFIESYNNFCFSMDEVQEIEYFADIVTVFNDKLVEYPALQDAYDSFRELSIEYIRVLKKNSVMDVLQSWKAHPYHSDLAYIVDNINSI
ncbi:DUF4365 domain-containing protein [Shewanella algae]|uniref:DUF4365 domain-containing protein n=1 Tax=Shewanella algae TaxID=38313 RepID=UPI001AADD983|nr:DUF4365 domain-containing protein [Shewanella algae]EKT4489127.1 DUF4365 domain-containing protein [Shewanella algae]MBO2548179.1 DUF4365 domain-containing protein [Shewanella algae]QTE88280.1 DUF4365 domain-containing protein [Shewanella algae]